MNASRPEDDLQQLIEQVSDLFPQHMPLRNRELLIGRMRHFGLAATADMLRRLIDTPSDAGRDAIFGIALQQERWRVRPSKQKRAKSASQPPEREPPPVSGRASVPPPPDRSSSPPPAWAPEGVARALKTILRESGVQTALRAFEQALTESALESPELRDREIMLDLAKHMMRAQSLID